MGLHLGLQLGAPPRKTAAGDLPGAISDLDTGSEGTDFIDLTFTDAAGATSHQYRLDGGAWTALASDKTITGLTTLTEYAIEVRGVNASGNGPASNVLIATTD